MAVLLVRHAHAGSKEEWHGDDRLRPLSERGQLEALAVADALAPYAPRRLVSSPFLRCIQTVQTLARRLDLKVEESELLVPEAGRHAAAFVRSLARDGDGPVVVCTHGETIEVLQKRFGRSTKLPFEPGSPHEKGSTWVLRVKNGRFTGAEYLPPGRSGAASLSGGGAPRV
jgi:8-oxo-(d)GTP phosphatase